MLYSYEDKVAGGWLIPFPRQAHHFILGFILIFGIEESLEKI
jgi:hypothetical protein